MNILSGIYYDISLNKKISVTLLIF